MARRKSIYDSLYQTPFADFLEQIPDYLLKYEQIKQNEADTIDRRNFRNKQYEDARNQQILQNQRNAEKDKYNRALNSYNTAVSQIERMDYSSDIKAKMISNVNAQPMYDVLNLDNVRTDDYKTTMQDRKENFTSYDARFREIEKFNDEDKFANYAEIETLREDMGKDREKYSGTSWEKQYDIHLNRLDTVLVDLSNKAGKFKGSDAFSASDKKLFTEYSDVRKKLRNTLEEQNLRKERVYQQKKRLGWKEEEINEDSEYKEVLADAEVTKNRIAEYDKNINEIESKPEYRYPSITTSAEISEMKELAQEQTRWVNEHDDLWILDPDTRLQLLSDEPMPKEQFDKVKSIYEAWKKSEDESSRRSEAYTAKLMGEGEIVDDEIPDDEIPEAWLEPATEPEEVVEDDVFSELTTEEQLEAKRLKDRGLSTEQIFARLDEERVEPEEKLDLTPEKTDIPAVAEPLTARDNREREAEIERRAEVAKSAEMFPEVKEVSLEDLENSNIKDSKGNAINFKSRMSFEKSLYELDSSLKKLQKDLRRSAPRQKQIEIATEIQRIANDLKKSTDTLNLKGEGYTEKNLKSAMNTFLKTRKYKTADRFIKYLDDVMQWNKIPN